MLHLWFQKHSQGFDTLSVSGIASVCYRRFNEFKLCCVGYHVWLCISHTVNNFPQENCFSLKLILMIINRILSWENRVIVEIGWEVSFPTWRSRTRPPPRGRPPTPGSRWRWRPICESWKNESHSLLFINVDL